MKTIMKREIEISAPKEKVWTAIAKVGDICHGHPGVLTSHLTSKQTHGVGTTRHCDFAMMGATAEERVTEWIEGEYMKIVVDEVKKMPGIKDISLDFSVRAQGPNSILTSTMEYSMKNRFFDLVNALVMKRQNSQLLDGIMAGHKKYIEEGKIVTQSTILELDKVKFLL
jgi:hypothetical protein